MNTKINCSHRFTGQNFHKHTLFELLIHWHDVGGNVAICFAFICIVKTCVDTKCANISLSYVSK